MKPSKVRQKYINRAARHKYSIEDKIEAGIRLMGYEVKGIREGRVNLKDGFVQIQNGEAWLFNVHVGLPSNARVDNFDPNRKRKLLLHKSEIDRLKGKIDAKNVTAIPLELKWVRNRVKILIGIGKGRKKHDKRRKLDERESKKEIRKFMKQSV